MSGRKDEMLEYLLCWASRLRTSVEGGADLGEGLVGVTAQGRDGVEADGDDQRQDHRVFDCRRTVFTFQEFRHETSQCSHLLPLPSRSRIHAFRPELPTTAWPSAATRLVQEGRSIKSL